MTKSTVAPVVLDRFDHLAIDIIADVGRLSFVAARGIIATRLRTLAAKERRDAFNDAVAAVEWSVKC